MLQSRSFRRSIRSRMARSSLSSRRTHRTSQTLHRLMQSAISLPNLPQMAQHGTQSLRDFGKGPEPRSMTKIVASIDTTGTKCDLFFADKAILIEGPTERLLMPRYLQLIDAKLDESRALAPIHIDSRGRWSERRFSRHYSIFSS